LPAIPILRALPNVGCVIAHPPTGTQAASALTSRADSERSFQFNLHKKSWQKGVLYPIFEQINASPDDIRKAAVADARRTLEAAAHFTRGGGAPTPDHDADYACRAGRIEAEQRRLIQWAEENGKLAFSGRLPPVFAQGGEHDVFFQKRTQRYLKATRQDRHKGYGIALG
jgi:hypothetical protein